MHTKLIKFRRTSSCRWWFKNYAAILKVRAMYKVLAGNGEFIAFTQPARTGERIRIQGIPTCNASRTCAQFTYVYLCVNGMLAMVCKVFELDL